MTCRAYVVAQWEVLHPGARTARDGLASTRSTSISLPGKRTACSGRFPREGRPVRSEASSSRTGRRVRPCQVGKRRGEAADPVSRYFFRILKAQGPHAPGGKFSYVINRQHDCRFALVAFPDKWESSGVMTFIVNQQGRVYQKNLARRRRDRRGHEGIRTRPD